MENLLEVSECRQYVMCVGFSHEEGVSALNNRRGKGMIICQFETLLPYPFFLYYNSIFKKKDSDAA